MNKIFTIVRKDLRLRFSGFIDWLFFLILPVVFTLVLAGGTGPSADNRIRLVVVDQAGSPLSADLLTALEKSEAIRPVSMNLAKAESQFSQRSVSAILIIPADFDQEHLLTGDLTLELRQQPNNTNAIVDQQAVLAALRGLDSAASIALASVTQAEQIRTFNADPEKQAYFDASLAQAQTLLAAAPSRLTISQGTTADAIEYDPRSNSSAGQMITWVFIPLIGLSELFALERQTGTLRRILTTPTGKPTYLFGTIAGQVLVALFQMALLVGFGVLVMKLDWVRSWDGLAGLTVMLLAAALAAAALGTMLGTLVKSSSQANGLSIMLGMVMALLGGCWYPLEFFPNIVQQIVKILPTTWAMQGLLDIVLRGRGLLAVLPEAGVLAGFAAIFFVIGIWRFRYE
jgi:ABC-2 type transport system permease protein